MRLSKTFMFISLTVGFAVIASAAGLASGKFLVGCQGFPDMTLRDAADHMVRENVGRLPVITRADPSRVVGIITRSDLLRAHEARLAGEES